MSEALLKELHSKLDSKYADQATINNISEQLTKQQEEFQAKFIAADAEKKALEQEVTTLKNQMLADYKNKSRIGFAEGDNDSALLKEYKKQVNSFLRKNTVPTTEAVEEAARVFVEKHYASLDGFEKEREIKALVSGSNPDGGYLINPDQRTDFQVGRIFETSPMRTVSRVITTTSNEVEILIDDNAFASGGWVGEVQTRAETNTAKIGRLTIAAHEQYAQPKVTQKMLDDSSIDLESWVSQEVSDIFSRTENTAFVVGTGAASPKGFLSYPAWASADVYETGKLEQVNLGSATEVTADGLITLQNSLVEEYQPNAVFMMKRQTWGQILKLKSGVGDYQINSMILSEGGEQRLLGKRVFFANDIPAVATNQLSVAYGDFGVGYTIVDRLGIRVIRDNLTEKPYVKFYTTKRVGGAVTNYQSIKIGKIAV